jgi:hypothetical protein
MMSNGNRSRKEGVMNSGKDLGTMPCEITGWGRRQKGKGATNN